MLSSKDTYPLSAAAIEAIHDHLIAVAFPGIEPVEQNTCLQLNLLLSAEQQPYQEFFEMEPYPTLADKAAYLFFHLTTSHIFENGNKRTAVLALDAFLGQNGYLLTLDNKEVLMLAKQVASAGERGERAEHVLEGVRVLLQGNILPFTELEESDPEPFRVLVAQRRELQDWKINRVGHPLRQTYPSS